MTDITASDAPRLNSSRLILWATIAGSVALSIVSAYETWLGLNDFMPAGIIGGIMAFILTFGVQVILFAISWSIAEHVRDGFKSNIWRIAIWVMCAFFSGYFSFYGFFQGTGGRDEGVRSAYIEGKQDEIFANISTSFAASLETRHQNELLNTIEYDAWIQELDSVIQAANGAQAQIEANNLRESGILRTQQRELRDERDQLRTDRSGVEAQARQSARTLADLRQQDSDLRARGVELRNILVRLEGERDALQVQYDQETVTGVGRRARAIQLDLNSKEGEVIATTRLIERNLQDIQDLEPRLETAEISAEDNVAEQRRNEIDTRIEEIEDQVAAIDTKLVTLNQGINFDLQSQSTTLTQQRTLLEGQNYAAYDELVRQCASLKQQLTDSNVGQSTADVNCSNSTILTAVSNLRTLQSQAGSFRTDCIENRPVINTPEGSLVSEFNPTLSHLRECALQEPDEETRASLRTQTSDISADRADDAQPIKQASVALFQDLQANAILSFVFAAIVDLLVLLCALVGKNIGTPQSVRAIDKLISMMRKSQDINSTAEAVVTLPNDEHTMDLIDPIVTRLIRDGYAEFDDQSTGGGSQLILAKGARIYLARLRGMEISEQTVKGGARRDPEATLKPTRSRQRPKRPI